MSISTTKQQEKAGLWHLHGIIKAAVTFIAKYVNESALTIKALAGQTANLFEIQDSAGVPTFYIGSLMAGLASNSQVAWSATTAASAAKDVGLSRLSAGVLGVGTGAVGSYAGGLQLTTFGLGVTPVVRGAALTAQLTTVTHTAPVTPDYAIQDLTITSPYGFVTKDEGNSVLSTIANLQARVAQLEDRLGHTGGFGLIDH